MSGRWSTSGTGPVFRSGVGYTVYIGSEYEPLMLYQASQIVNMAHKHGLITVLWMYPRGAAVKDERNSHLVAGAAGVAAAIGSDFAKVNPPKIDGVIDAALLSEAAAAAGRTGVVCSGGTRADVPEFLQQLHDQIHIGGMMGTRRAETFTSGRLTRRSGSATRYRRSPSMMRAWMKH